MKKMLLWLLPLLVSPPVFADIIQSYPITIAVKVDLVDVLGQAGIYCTREKHDQLPSNFHQTSQAFTQVPLVDGSFSGTTSVKSEFIIDGRYPRVDKPIPNVPTCKLMLRHSDSKKWVSTASVCSAEADASSSFVPTVTVESAYKYKNGAFYIAKNVSSRSSLMMDGAEMTCF